MTLKWGETFLVGVTVIDNQHKELFSIINKLHDKINQDNNSKGDIERTIKFLEKYVVEHFSLEESYMTKHAYPDYLAHKAEHSKFIEDFLDLKKEFENGCSNSYLKIQLRMRLNLWLINHISKTDTKLGKFLKTKM